MPGAPSLAPATRMGTVALTVADLDRMQSFYQRVIGLRTLSREGDVARLGILEGEVLVELVHDPDAPGPPPRATGLFHLALLVPDRPELARTVRRVVDAGWRFTGASDHLVSEALYLDDPEGNGIELYRDRPREGWGRENGDIRMTTMPLDLDGVMAELPEGPDEGMPPGTVMGHVHLKVADIPSARAFYAGPVGFDVTVQSYPSALFVSAGGYHHHLGLNTWQSAGGPAPPAGSLGLRRYTIVAPDRAELERLRERLARAGADAVEEDGDLGVTDPAGNRLAVRAA